MQSVEYPFQTGMTSMLPPSPCSRSHPQTPWTRLCCRAAAHGQTELELGVRLGFGFCAAKGKQAVLWQQTRSAVHTPIYTHRKTYSLQSLFFCCLLQFFGSFLSWRGGEGKASSLSNSFTIPGTDLYLSKCPCYNQRKLGALCSIQACLWASGYRYGAERRLPQVNLPCTSKQKL